jgi:beta-phosphoglucomutase family hydrolase
MLQALLFDMNGVVVDDMAYHERSWIELAAQHGRTLTIDEMRTQMSGRRNRDNIHHIFGADLSEAQIEAYQAEKETAYRDAFRPHLAPLPGLLELLDAARAAKLKIALVTSAPPENIDFVLDGLRLRDRFDTVVGEVDVKKSKPDPEIYLLAASRLGAKPSGCIVFEDSLAGIASGRAARMPVVGLTTTHSAGDLRDCAIVVPDFRGLTVADLARLVA